MLLTLSVTDTSSLSTGEEAEKRAPLLPLLLCETGGRSEDGKAGAVAALQAGGLVIQWLIQ